MGTRRHARIAAFQAIYAWEETRTDAADLASLGWLDKQPEEDEHVFASLLIAGTLENMEEIDNKIRTNLRKWSFDRLARVDLAILRTSTYSLLYQKDIPSSVTIDEAVEIAKQFGTPESYRFVNGVLDGILKATLS
jgi:N utilization substance protein B